MPWWISFIFKCQNIFKMMLRKCLAPRTGCGKLFPHFFLIIFWQNEISILCWICSRMNQQIILIRAFLAQSNRVDEAHMWICTEYYVNNPASHVSSEIMYILTCWNIFPQIGKTCFQFLDWFLNKIFNTMGFYHNACIL